MSTERRAPLSIALVAILLGVPLASFAQESSSGAGQGAEDDTLRPHSQRVGIVARGEAIFFNETFGGNGRTCGTCHPAENNFTLDPVFIATLPRDDPLFVAEFNPVLAGLENPRLLREFGLILENVDGFDQPGVLRGVPHTLGLSTSVSSVAGPRTGWSGDGAGALGDGSLRSFAIGAVIQHFTKTLNRVPGVDFRLPTDAELDALVAFQLSRGRALELSLPLPLKGTVASRGQEIFLNNSLGKCNLCHVNAGATANLGGALLGNINFDIGVEDLPEQPARLTGELIPPDGGLGTTPRPVPPGGFGDGSFNIPPLVEAADTPPFFHNNAIATIEGAVAFYNSLAFNNSLAALAIGGGINLDATQVEAVAAFLRVINTLENIRSAIEFQRAARRARNPKRIQRLLNLASGDLGDAISVLASAGLHPDAVRVLGRAKVLNNRRRTRKAISQAIRKEQVARNLIVGP